MKTRPKDQGTFFETWLVKKFRATGFGDAWRLAEGGANDEGDVEYYDRWGSRHVIEAKARANLNVTQTLAKAKAKTTSKNVAVIWKKLTRKAGNERRTPDGEPVVVIIDLDMYLYLLNR